MCNVFRHVLVFGGWLRTTSLTGCLGRAAKSRVLDSMVLTGPFQQKMFCHSVNLLNVTSDHGYLFLTDKASHSWGLFYASALDVC